MLDMGFGPRYHADFSAAQKNARAFTSRPLWMRAFQESLTRSHDPLLISVKAGQTSANVEQDVVRYRHIDQKIDLLHDTLITDPAMKAVILTTRTAA